MINSVLHRAHLLDDLEALFTNLPEKIVFREVNSKGETAISYSELYLRVERFGSELKQSGGNDTVLLLFNETIDFVVAFLACQAAGKIPVPMFFPRSIRYFQRLQNIIEDSECSTILCAEAEKSKIQKGLNSVDISLEIISEDKSNTERPEAYSWKINPIAFIQYTSGSTGNPKGVVVSQKNLMHNQKLIQETFKCDEDSVILSWLPFYHDMGLIGNLLHTIYVGCSAIMLSPVDVVQNPIVWLENIASFKVTHSGGPNFIYDKCVEAIDTTQTKNIDLSSWQVAYNGSEPIKANTLRNFTSKFKDWNFNVDSLKNCYGLAEATLIVSGGNPTFFKDNDTVGSGEICEGISVVFFDQKTDSVNDYTGEICIAGDSVTEGYWKKDNSQYFIEYNGEKFLRTGDVGRFEDNQLIVLGREKEIIIINGKNYYPYDIEEEIVNAVEQIDSNGVAITQVEIEGHESLLVFAEISRKFLSKEELFPQVVKGIENTISQLLGIESYDIVLISTRKLPRTSSGKIQRIKLRDLYKKNEFTAIYQKLENKEEVESSLSKYLVNIEENPLDSDAIDAYLVELIREKLSMSEGDTETIKNSNLYELGVSSLIGVDIVHQINKDLNLQLDVSQVLEQGELEKIREFILSLLWIKSQPSTQQEIEL